MRKVSLLILASTLAVCLSAPANAQFWARGSGYGSSFGGGTGFGGGAYSGGAFGGGAPFGNGSIQMYNPAINQYRYWGAPAVSPYGYGYGYPGQYYGMPIGIPGASSFFRIGPVGIQYWRSPSGYYYPWGGGTTYGVPAQIYYVNEGQTQAQTPPVYSMLSDMRSYLDECKKNGRLSDADYQHLFRRVQDLQGKYDHLMAMNGSLDTSDEDSIRRDAGLLGSEISQRVKPLSSGSSKANGVQNYSAQPAQSGASPRSESKSGWIEEQ